MHQSHRFAYCGPPIHSPLQQNQCYVAGNGCNHHIHVAFDAKCQKQRHNVHVQQSRIREIADLLQKRFGRLKADGENSFRSLGASLPIGVHLHILNGQNLSQLQFQTGIYEHIHFWQHRFLLLISNSTIFRFFFGEKFSHDFKLTATFRDGDFVLVQFLGSLLMRMCQNGKGGESGCSACAVKPLRCRDVDGWPCDFENPFLIPFNWDTHLRASQQTTIN